MTLSLHRRVLLAASLVLAAFLGATGLALDRAFRDSAKEALHERLETYVYALLAAAELSDGGALTLPESLPDPRLATPGSGLYARIVDGNGAGVWESRSLIGAPDLQVPPIAAGRQPLERVTSRGGTERFLYRFGITWETTDGEARPFTIGVAEDSSRYLSEVRAFRDTLWRWLGGSALLLLAVQAVTLRWGLAPLRRIGQDLAAVREGGRERLEEGYPRELDDLARGMNAFIDNERRRLERYRNASADLAHSLKTPLAVLRGMVDAPGEPPSAETVREQVDRMDRIVQYQLGRAATSGRPTLGAAIEVAPVVDKLLATLKRVYAAREIGVEADVNPGVRFAGEQGDLLEMCGNVLDNAFKWCRTFVHVVTEQGEKPGFVVLAVEDDGPGIPDDMANRVTERGVRASDAADGQGIGLAVVRDIVEGYGGRVVIGRSEAGGARVELHLPGESG